MKGTVLPGGKIQDCKETKRFLFIKINTALFTNAYGSAVDLEIEKESKCRRGERLSDIEAVKSRKQGYLISRFTINILLYFLDNTNKQLTNVFIRQGIVRIMVQKSKDVYKS